MHGLDSENSTSTNTELETANESIDLNGDVEPMVTDDINHTERDQVSNEALQDDSMSISSITGICYIH